MQTAKEIADEYGAGDVALELAILRHMEGHIKAHREAEREACAKLVEKLASADAVYPEGMRMIAAAIRARSTPTT